MIRLLLAALAAAQALPAAAVETPPRPTVCLASEHGAAPSQVQYATRGLQGAIDACRHACGTAVVDRPGAYLTAALRLSGCVHLLLPAGVTLLAGDQREDYGAAQPDWYLLHFHNCTRCSLSGGGTVDGRARLWVLPQPQPAPGDSGWRQLSSTGRGLQLAPPVEGHGLARPASQPPLPEAVQLARKAVRNWRDPSCPKPEECRPRLVGVVDSSHVSISGITLTDPVYWCLHVLRSSHVALANLAIRGDWGIPNNDGIDVDGSRHVSITGTDVDTADDAICLKTTSPGHPLEHVAVSGCRLRSRSSAVKLGSESVADMRHISFAELEVVDSHRGLAIQLRDSGTVEHVAFRNCSISTRLYHPSWWGAAEPIYVTALPRSPATRVGSVRNISFVGVQAQSENGIFLAGGPLAGGSTIDAALHSSSSSSSSSTSAAMATGSARQVPGGGGGRHSLSAITLQQVRVQLVWRSQWAGGCQDYRPSTDGGSPAAGSGAPQLSSRAGASPGSSSSSSSSSTEALASRWPAGLDCSSGSTAPLWVSGAADVLLSDVELAHRWPWRPDWRRQPWIDPGSTAGVVLHHVDVSVPTAVH